MNQEFQALNIEVPLTDGASAFVCIHSVLNHTSSGGVRVSSDLSRDEVAALAAEMTLKYSLFSLGRGGAKSGISVPPGISVDQKRTILAEFGRRICPLIHAGLYYPGMDMNCGPDDLRAIYKGAGMSLGTITDSSFFTAVSVANAMEVIRAAEGAARPLRVAIEGFGSVARHLVERLPEEYYRVVCVSTIKGAAARDDGFPVGALLTARWDHGDDCVFYLPGGQTMGREAVLTANVDVLVPAARTWVIHAGNVENVRARWIVAAANVPCTAEVVTRLQERGIVYLPGFVCNAGGVFGSSLFDVGVRKDRVEEVSRTLYREVVEALIKRSRATRRSLVELAETVALRRFRFATLAGKGLGTRFLRHAWRRGLFPRPLYAMIRLRQFEESLRNLRLEIGTA